MEKKLALQDSYIDHRGKKFNYHAIVFPEEVPFLASDQIHNKSSQVQISESERVNLEGFVKFFREKYRLCWKEIYLKFSSILYNAELCNVCREYFQLCDVADCKCNILEDVEG